MISYEGFKKRHYPQKKVWGNYSVTDLAMLKGHLPTGIIEFLEIEGLSSYSQDFLWTTQPKDFHDILSRWGLNGNKCFTFMRSAFGACIYYFRKEFFYLDPLQGRIVSLGDDPYLLLNISLILDAILINGFYEDYFRELKVDSKVLNPDEVFTFVPAIPLGGSFETSKVEIAKMREHLCFLAQLFEGNAKRI